MHYFVLKDHNMSLCYSTTETISDTNVGIWLEENNINYKVSAFEKNIAINVQHFLHDVIIIECLEFETKEDMVAFKLRWS